MDNKTESIQVVEECFHNHMAKGIGLLACRHCPDYFLCLKKKDGQRPPALPQC